MMKGDHLGPPYHRSFPCRNGLLPRPRLPFLGTPTLRQFIALPQCCLALPPAVTLYRGVLFRGLLGDKELPAVSPVEM